MPATFSRATVALDRMIRGLGATLAIFHPVVLYQVIMVSSQRIPVFSLIEMILILSLSDNLLSNIRLIG